MRPGSGSSWPCWSAGKWAFGRGLAERTHLSRPAVSRHLRVLREAGAEAALLAPTAVNQQKFLLALQGDGVRAEALKGPCSRIDLGIVKYQFELGAGWKPWI